MRDPVDPRDIDHDVTGQTVLVTGGAGFVGRHLVTALASDNAVRVFDDLSTGSRGELPDGVEFVPGDVRDETRLVEAAAGADLVFHEAAQVSVEQSVEAPVETTATNATGTVAVLEAARRADARAVVASSAAVYGQPETVPVAETHPKEPLSPYGVSKLAADRYTRLYADLYGLPTVALRYFNIYGPGQRGDAGVVPIFFEQARRGDPITIAGDGEQTRDFVHVRDVVAANLRAATADVAGVAFNVGTGEQVTIRELAALIRDAAGSDSPIVHVAKRDGDLRHSCADITRARDHLGFDPAVSLASGLASLARHPVVEN